MPPEVSASVVEMDDEALLEFPRRKQGSRVTDPNWIPKVEQNSERKESAWSWIFPSFQNPSCHVIIAVYIFFCLLSSKAHWISRVKGWWFKCYFGKQDLIYIYLT
jgi:hypothetical protein